jgi:hypothetical protein
MPSDCAANRAECEDVRVLNELDGFQPATADFERGWEEERGLGVEFKHVVHHAALMSRDQGASYARLAWGRCRL